MPAPIQRARLELDLMKVLSRYLCLCSVALLAAGEAAAQQAIDPATLPPTQAIDAPAAERVFGNWGGLQDDLVRQGIGLKIDAVTEFAANVSGGTHEASSFANQVGFNLDINWERLADVTGLSTHLTIVNRSGTNTSRAFGDNLLPVQEIYGSGGNVLLHLVSIYAQETMMDGRLDVAIGRMNVENDFGSSPLYCAFMNNGLCGDPKALPGGDIGHSAYPDAAWGLRVKGRPVPDFLVTAGIYEVNQGMYSYANFRSGFKFDSSQDSGVYLPIEIAWEPKFGADEMLGHYRLGFGYDSSGTYKAFSNALGEAGLPGYGTGTHTGNTQFWALADQMLFRNGDGNDNGVVALAGYILNDPNNTVYADQYIVGVIDKGFWAARPQDQFGILFSYVTASDRLAKVQAIQQAHGLPFSNGATGIQSNEMFVEANYLVHVSDGLTFMPDFQYIIRPNAQSNIQDAPVFGFRAYIDF
ncbi:MAG TPA: carbohydrate porin [Alphaproteobacteria bacterium]|nr:carbohydrate porin [Alphaproteobacteria bacterium]